MNIEKRIEEARKAWKEAEDRLKQATEKDMPTLHKEVWEKFDAYQQLRKQKQ